MSRTARAVALFPGTFDPITEGHVEIIRRGRALFHEIVIGVGVNSAKSTMYGAEQRMAWINELFSDDPHIRAETFTDLTVAFARRVGADFILRGLRNAPDFEYERNIDLLNKHLDDGLETVYMISSPATAHISSSLVREVIRFRGELRGLAPAVVVRDVYSAV